MPNKKAQSIKIYLAGRIPIGNEKGIDHYWREKYISKLKKIIPGVIFLDPTFRDINEIDSLAVFGHDLFLIKQANLVIVNAEVSIGIGTAQEMILARYFQKPVISISPRGTFYSPFKEKVNGKEVNNWRHPFLNTLSDWIVEDVKEIKPILMEELKNKKIPKWESFIKRAMEYYLKEYFPRDIKTQKMVKI